MERWNRLLLELSHGETVWHNSAMTLHWVMPEREDFLRRHLVLDRNLEYQSHERAAYNAPTATTPSASPSPDPVTAQTSSSPVSGGGGGIFAYNLEPGEEIVHVFESATWVTPSVVSHGRCVFVWFSI